VVRPRVTKPLVGKREKSSEVGAGNPLEDPGVSRRSLGAKQGEGVTLVILTLRLVKAQIEDLGTGRSTGLV
jgi:hypothetical protein